MIFLIFNIFSKISSVFSHLSSNVCRKAAAAVSVLGSKQEVTYGRGDANSALHTE